jgi:dihydroflavonol-4-reductase
MPRDHDELIRPARDGALRVLKAAKAAGVKRVVMTSSMAAIAYGWGDARPNPLTEEHWSNSDNLKDNTAYTRSKTIAERAAWDYMAGEGKGMELSVINPSAVLGPAMSRDLSTSLEIITQLMTGKAPASPRVGFCVVDVRDVADAHVKAMTVPEAAGERFLASGRFMWMSEVADVLRESFPDYRKKLPRGELPDWLLKMMTLINPPLKAIVPELGRERHCSNEKAKQVLGWRPRMEEEAIIEGARSLIDLNVI